MARRYPHSYIWRVEYVRMEERRTYKANRAMTVICEKIDDAIAQVYKAYPEAIIIKCFRGQDYGYDGVVIVEVEESDG